MQMTNSLTKKFKILTIFVTTVATLLSIQVKALEGNINITQTKSTGTITFQLPANISIDAIITSLDKKEVYTSGKGCANYKVKKDNTNANMLTIITEGQPVFGFIRPEFVTNCTEQKNEKFLKRTCKVDTEDGAAGQAIENGSTEIACTKSSQPNGNTSCSITVTVLPVDRSDSIIFQRTRPQIAAVVFMEAIKNYGTFYYHANNLAITGKDDLAAALKQKETNKTNDEIQKALKALWTKTNSDSNDGTSRYLLKFNVLTNLLKTEKL